MTRRVKRTGNFQLTLEITNNDFIATPRLSQRNWLLNRVNREFSEELNHLDKISTRFVVGKDAGGMMHDRSQRPLEAREIMEDWQIPVMREMARLVTGSHGDILEIGFGRGISSDFIQTENVKSHTIIECNKSQIPAFDKWRASHPDADIRIIWEKWQDAISDLGKFDGIFFHTYPLNETEFVDQVAQSSTFAEHFFETASRHLRAGGIFTYLTNEADSLSRAHQRALFKNFSSFSLSRIAGLDIPDDTQDAIWSDSMVLVRVVR